MFFLLVKWSIVYFFNLLNLKSNINGGLDVADDDDDDEDWPPFRLAGLFDPFMDDNRLAVQVIRLVDNTLLVGGAAGQVMKLFGYV